MFTKFLSLEAEKQERIINAALKEFALKGYDHASTNTIVKEANISKGLLFHYFKNKKDLYLFLYDHSLQLFSSEFFQKIDFSEPDLLLRLRQVASIKLELIKKYPELFNFLLSGSLEDSEDVKDDLERRYNEALNDSYAKLFNNIDLTKFKDDINVTHAVDIIIWTIDGLTNKKQAELKQNPSSDTDYEQAFAEFDSYIELLKQSFYR